MASPKKINFTTDRSLPGYRSTAPPFFSARSHEPVWRTLRSSIVLGEGVVVVTGEAGIGKTQLLLRLQGVLPENRDIALVLDAAQPLASFTQMLCKATGTHIAGPNAWAITPKELLGAIANRVKNGRKFLVAVDQAHRLSEENLAILNRLVLFSMNHARPVQILLVGRPELSEYLELSAFRTLKNAVMASIEMPPLTRVEVWEYIRFQTHKSLGATIRMTWPAWLEIFAASRGNPQEVDILLQKALFLVQERGVRILTGSLVREGRMDLDPDYHPPPGRRLMPWVSLASLVLVLGSIIGTFFSFSPAPQQGVTIEKNEQQNVPALAQNVEDSKAGIGPVILPKMREKNKKILPPPPLTTMPQETHALSNPLREEEMRLATSDPENVEEVPEEAPGEAPSVAENLGKLPTNDMPEILPLLRSDRRGPLHVMHDKTSPERVTEATTRIVAVPLPVPVPVPVSVSIPIPVPVPVSTVTPVTAPVTVPVPEPLKRWQHQKETEPPVVAVQVASPTNLSRQSSKGEIGSVVDAVVPALLAPSALAKEVTHQKVGQLYVVQIGSFLNRGNAEQFVHLLTKKGLKPYVHPYQKDKEPWFTVRIDYLNRHAAERTAQSVSKDTHVSAKVINLFDE